jgi:dTDP-4-amino-4,6-dideoxygalactose transaminase
MKSDISQDRRYLHTADPRFTWGSTFTEGGNHVPFDIAQEGATPVPIEPNPNTHNIVTTRIEAAITPRTRALLRMHIYGQPADLYPMLEFVRCYRLRVIQDASQAHGARYEGRRIGAHGKSVCWSFCPGNNLSALGDAGAITTIDGRPAERMALLRNYGSKQNYVNEETAANSRPDHIQAAVPKVKLHALDEWTRHRRFLAAAYAEGLYCTGIILPPVPNWAAPVWNLYVIRTHKLEALRAQLVEKGIGTLIHYSIPPHMQAKYAHLRIEPGSLTIYCSVTDELLSITIDEQLELGYFNKVVTQLQNIAWG